jgi:hypothetical protein
MLGGADASKGQAWLSDADIADRASQTTAVVTNFSPKAGTAGQCIYGRPLRRHLPSRMSLSFKQCSNYRETRRHHADCFDHSMAEECRGDFHDTHAAVSRRPHFTGA